MNWWLAALEHFGLITRDEALHIANEIKNSIHKDNYVDAYDELEGILGKIKYPEDPIMAKLRGEVVNLKLDVDELRSELRLSIPAVSLVSDLPKAKPIATPKKA